MGTKDETPEYLPEQAIIECEPAPKPAELVATTQLSEAISADLITLNYVLKQLHKGFAAVMDIDELVKLSLATCKVIEFRRRALLYPFEAAKNTGVAPPPYNPLDRAPLHPFDQ